MTPLEIVLAAQHVLSLTLLLVSPFLGAALIIGLLVSIIQAGTRMNDMTLHFVPRFLAVVLMIAVLGAWMANRMSGYVHESAAAMVSSLE
jgi:flagellar biosynthetic protein FliQ